ncbi:MAG: CoA-disulfide reductase [Alkaliphilus sp.]
MSKKTIIVGGVAGGASAAARLRRLDEKTEIIMFERGEYISFANCGLPYFIGGVIQERDALLVQTVEGMAEKFNMDIRIFSEVISIQPSKKMVTVKNLKTNETYEESYDTLVLSPGANPIKPPIPGIDEATNLFTLRTIPDTDAIKEYIESEDVKSATVIGGGFIGIEMAENLHHLGLDVAIVEMAEQIMAPIDFEMASMLHGHIRSKKAKLILNDGVKSFSNSGKQIELSSGTMINTDLIIFAIGVSAESSLAKDAGLELGERRGIKVNEYLQTSDPNIYAIGDAIEVTDYVSGKPAMIPLAGPANKQGRIVANNICGEKIKFSGTMGTSVAKVFDMTVAATGNNEKLLKRFNFSYEVLHIHPGSHAGYYPGAFPISIKILFNKETRKILGAQAVGFTGVEKRIDVIATAMKGNLKITDLADLELSYAPPFSSAKDPVNMLGFYAENILKGKVTTFQWYEIDELVKNNEFLLDVRDDVEVQLGTIQNSINIPLAELRKRLEELPKDKTVYVFCQVGIRGYLAARILMQNGYKVENLDGGYKIHQCVNSGADGFDCITPVDDSGVSVMEAPKENNTKAHIVLDACGLQCPGPIMKVFKNIETMNEGEILEISATDPGFATDIKAWCEKTGNTLVKNDFTGKAFTALIKKGNDVKKQASSSAKNNSTIVVFSQDLDKALASFIIASGAASMGKEVTLFFTFWGLNVLRKKKGKKVKKDILEKMFGFMMPKGTGKLPISNMNMGGMGSKMIQYVMNHKNVDSLDIMMKNAMDVNVKLVACAMSMDIMGIKAEELIDGVEIGGVASYLAKAEDSNLNLFI